MATRIGDLTKLYRKSHHISLRAFAARCGISRSYLNVLEKGDSETGITPIPSTKILLAIAQAMEMEPASVFKAAGIPLPALPEKKDSTGKTVTIEPFEYIPPTIDNVKAAIQEGRFLVLPFRPPQKRDLVYIPTLENEGMVVAHTVIEVLGGVFRARSEFNGIVEFTLFDIGKTVFLGRKDAYNQLREMKKS